MKNEDERPEYHRVQVKMQCGTFSVASTGNQISSRLNSMVGANGLAVIAKIPNSKEKVYSTGFFGDVSTTPSQSYDKVLLFDTIVM